jgi:uroporphyrinogen decarboxylase
MNSKERVLNALAFRKSDRVPVVPFIIGFAAKYAGAKFIDYAKNPAVIAESQMAVARRFRVDAVYVDSDPVVEIEAMGARVEYPEDESPMASTPTVMSSHDVRLLRVADPEKDGRLPVWLDAIRILKEKAGSEYAVFANVNGPFQAAAQLLGISETARCLLSKPDLLLDLLDLTTQTVVDFMRAEVQAGVDAVLLGDAMSSTSFISPKALEQFSFPFIQNVIRQAEGRVPFILHICGDATRIIDKMVATGARYLELDSLVDLAQVRKNHGNSVGIIGNVSPMLLLFGTPQEVDEECRKAIQAGGLDGAYILGSGCEVPKNTPHENLDAMVRAAEEYGRFL